MADQQLLDYIKEQTNEGISSEDIKNALLQNGWNGVDVNEAFSVLQNHIPAPSAPMPPSATVAPSLTANTYDSQLASGKQQLDPRAVWIFFFNTLYIWVFIALAIVLQVVSITSNGSSSMGSFFSATTFLWSVVVFVAVIILSYIIAKLSYHFYKFELTNEGYKAERGIIWKRYISIPYERIQNVDIYRGLLSRMLGLSDLNIQTAGYSAGGSGSEGRLPGLSIDDAEKVRSELIRRSKGAKQSF